MLSWLLPGGIVALGKFDALHIGHRELAIQASRAGPPFLLSFVGMAKVLGWEQRYCILYVCIKPIKRFFFSVYMGGKCVWLVHPRNITLTLLANQKIDLYKINEYKESFLSRLRLCLRVWREVEGRRRLMTNNLLVIWRKITLQDPLKSFVSLFSEFTQIRGF